MKFKLDVTKRFYPQGYEMEELKELGFTFTPCSYNRFIVDGFPEININSQEEIMEFVSKYGKIVISEEGIEIYNDYRE